MANNAITKRVIHTGFRELLNERTLNKITVKDITDRCGISRNTFYYHYQDITALLEEICTEDAEKIVAEHPTIDTLDECLEAVMRMVMDNRRAIMHIYNSDNRSIYVNSLWRMCEQTVSIYVNTALADTPISPADKALLVRYHKCECFGLILDWINSGLKEEYLWGIQRLCLLKKGSLEELARRSQQLPNPNDK